MKIHLHKIKKVRHFIKRKPKHHIIHHHVLHHPVHHPIQHGSISTSGSAPMGSRSGTLRPGILPKGTTTNAGPVYVPTSSNAPTTHGSDTTHGTTDSKGSGGGGSSDSGWGKALAGAAVGGLAMVGGAKALEAGGGLTGFGGKKLVNYTRKQWNASRFGTGNVKPLAPKERAGVIDKSFSKGYRKVTSPSTGKTYRLNPKHNYDPRTNTLKTNNGVKQLHESADGTRMVKDEWRYKPENESFVNKNSGENWRYNEVKNQYEPTNAEGEFEWNQGVFSNDPGLAPEGKGVEDFTDSIESVGQNGEFEFSENPGPMDEYGNVPESYYSDFDAAIADDAAVSDLAAGESLLGEGLFLI